MRVRRLRWRGVAVGAAALCLSGCGGGPPTRPAATTSACDVAEPALTLAASAGGNVSGGFPLGGFCREYTVHLPPNYDGTRAVPLVVALHGTTGTPAAMQAGSGLSRTADERGLIVVYPAGVQGAWDMKSGGRDTTFLRELVGRIQARANIDRRRIYVTGMSMGGGMADRVACDIDDVFAATAPISGTYGYSSVCNPRRPVPVFSVHGREDTVVPLVTLTGFSIADTWLAAWGRRNGCNPQPAVTTRGEYVETSYLSCSEAADVTLWIVDDLGHSWWPLSNDAIADFFERHPFPG